MQAPIFASSGFSPRRRGNRARELSDAETIIVIGYSLPDSDEFFHYFLPLGIIGPNIIRRIIVFDPNEQVGDHYRRLLSQAVLGRFELVPAKFSDAMHTIRARLNLHGSGG